MGWDSLRTALCAMRLALCALTAANCQLPAARPVRVRPLSHGAGYHLSHRMVIDLGYD